MNRTEIEEVFEELELMGYRMGTPRWGLICGSAIDAEICENTRCENCGHQGLRFHPFVKDETKSYRAFAVCPACGEGFEF